jgi:hypothetical protein
MVVHKTHHKAAHQDADPVYWVAAKVCEPEYESERKFLVAETAFVERKRVEASRRFLKWLSLPSWGIYGQKDWRNYEHKLDEYGRDLQNYAEDVEGGVLPVKFAVYNGAKAADVQIRVAVKVEDGRVDTLRKPPERPTRLDGLPKPILKLGLPKFQGFTRRHIKISDHKIAADLSGLGADDAAMLVNQLVHIHCGPDTQVTYEVSSKNIPRETGEVELQHTTLK